MLSILNRFFYNNVLYMVKSGDYLNKLLKIVFLVNKAFDVSIPYPPTNKFLVKREKINLRNLFLVNNDILMHFWVPWLENTTKTF